MNTASFHQIDAAESDYLYIESSQLRNAGSGLYTAIPIFKDERIAIFKGKKRTDKQAAEIAAKGRDQYFIVLPDGHILDSMPTFCFAKYANDASGPAKSSFKNNAKITLDDDDQVCLIALRTIKAGEEVFCAYGKPYWNKHSKGVQGAGLRVQER